MQPYPDTLATLIREREATALQLRWAMYAIYKTPVKANARYINYYQLVKLQVETKNRLADKLHALDATIDTYEAGQAYLSGVALKKIGFDSEVVKGYVVINFFTPQQ